MTGSGAFRAGLCSVSFRSLERAAVAELAAAAGLGAIEWGGDAHVPHGDLSAAADAAARSADAELEVVSYGSYLFLDAGAAAHADAVLDTAAALGAPGVRVWCAHGVEPGAPAADRVAVASAAALVAARAADRGITLTLEFHAGTLTASADSTVALLEEVGAPNLFTAWQPPYWHPLQDGEELVAIRSLAPRLSHVHVYDWDPDLTRHPLARRRERWRDRLEAASGAGTAATAAGVRRAALIEFVPGDDPAVLGDEASVLRWCLAGT